MIAANADTALLNGSRLLAKVLIMIQVYIAAGNRDVCLHNLFKKREVVLLFLLSLWMARSWVKTMDLIMLNQSMFHALFTV